MQLENLVQMCYLHIIVHSSYNKGIKLAQLVQSWCFDRVAGLDYYYRTLATRSMGKVAGPLLTIIDFSKLFMTLLGVWSNQHIDCRRSRVQALD